MRAVSIGVLFLAVPLIGWADINGTQALTAGSSFSLDTGATVSSGGDILWSGTSIALQGKATGYNLGNLGASAFSVLSQATLSSFAAGFNQTPIPASVLVVGDVFAVKTNGGNYAAALVTAASGTSLTIQFVTYGASSTPSGPTITQVLNNFSYTPAGFPNSGIAPGTLFVVIGSGLADPKAQAVLQSSAPPGLPTTLNGASVKVTINGTTTIPVFYYAIAVQLALVLPSNTPTGTAQITVTYNGQTSAPYSFQVTQSSMGFDSYYGSGTGLGVATNSVTGTLYGYANSVPPGTNVTLWGSGLGADAARDATFVGAAFPINNLAHVYVGGVDAPILYQGASGYPGVNQVNITIPVSSPTGCNVSLVGVTAAGVPTNFTTLPIGTGPCSDPILGPLSGNQQNLNAQGPIKVGALILAHSTSIASGGSSSVTDVAAASFQSVAGTTYANNPAAISLGGCMVSQTLGSSNTTQTFLDAGSLTVTNPSGTVAALTTQPVLPGYYSSLLPAGFISASGGTFTFKGAGGANVGAFTANLPMPTPLLSWTNASAAATVTRSAGLPVTWSGGAAGTYVSISGTSSSGSQTGSFTCIVPVAAGQFTVPTYVLGALPAGSGSVTITNISNATFQATGLDLGWALGEVSYATSGTSFK
jgi:uncharacterized protein (TIGR03437 family)